MRALRVSVAIWSLTLGVVGTAGADRPATSPAALRAHLRFLADDLLEGRGTGTRGFDLAALYVATQFEAAGLAPGGPSGSYLQPVPLRSARVDEGGSDAAWTRAGRRETLVYARDFVAFPNFHHERAEVESDVVFVGYGVSAPELKHDDYAGVDVRGKLVAVLSGAPSSFPGDQRAHHGQPAAKARLAADRGALGIVAIRPRQAETDAPWQRLVGQSRFASMRSLDEDGRPADAPESLQVALVLQADAAERLFDAAGRPLPALIEACQKGRVKPFSLGVDLRVRLASVHEDVRSANVVAVRRGSDPRLAQEVVVLSAHLDHLGVGEARDGDSIYNGAVDNASGVAGLLELARQLGSGPAPRRSLVLLAVTGEERGLLGSDYFARHPTLPGVVANLNLDMITMLAPLLDVIAYGAEHSSLGAVAERAARAMGVELSPDPWPEQRIFVRSDHYSFVRRGIPSLYLFPGLKRADAQIDARAEAQSWLRARYHAPQDDLTQAFDFEAGARFVDVVYRAAREVLDAEQAPTWNQGDFFGETFGSNAPAVDNRRTR